MKGIIVLWSGAIVDIPAGWALCNGTSGTPDLRDRFIIGAGGAWAPGDSGGSVDHNHSFNDFGHTHTISSGSGLASGVGKLTVTDSTDASGTTSTESNLPPYYALAFIMKL